MVLGVSTIHRSGQRLFLTPNLPPSLTESGGTEVAFSSWSMSRVPLSPPTGSAPPRQGGTG